MANPGVAPVPQRILVVQRNNIGDMVLTTPLLTGLRAAFPSARLDVLANSYNAAVLDGFAPVNQVHVYTKLKHRIRGESWLGNLFSRLALRHRLRKLAFDTILLNSGPADRQALAFATGVAGRGTRIIRFSDAAAMDLESAQKGGQVLLPYPADDGSHQVEKSALLATPLGLNRASVSGPCRISASAGQLAKIKDALANMTLPAVSGAAIGPLLTLGMHLSARRPDQRWGSAQYAALAQLAHARLACRILLLWSPGTAEDALHPGDDDKAREVAEALQAARIPVLAWPTATLPPLIAALSCCDLVVCPDGGAMHLAAGVGTPVVALFGSAEPRHWHPWGAAHRVLRPPGRQVADLDPAAVLEATLAVLTETSTTISH